MANEIKTLLDSIDHTRKDWKEDWKDAAVVRVDWRTDFSFAPRLAAKITLSALAADNSYNDSANGFVTAGFAVGQKVTVTGFTGNVVNNIVGGVVTAVTAAKLTIGGTDGNVIVDDAAGEAVTIVGSAEPVNTVLPAISGTTTVGQTLTSTSGTWVGSTPTYRYQWKNAGVKIAGANAATYVLVATDGGDVITCTVTATSIYGSTDATSAGTAAITP